MLNKIKSTKVIGLSLASIMMASAFAVAPVEINQNGVQTQEQVAHATAKFVYSGNTSQGAKNDAAHYAMQNAKNRKSSSIEKVGTGGKIELNGTLYQVGVNGKILKGGKTIKKTIYKDKYTVKKGLFLRYDEPATGKFSIRKKTGMQEKCEFFVYKGRIVHVNWSE